MKYKELRKKTVDQIEEQQLQYDVEDNKAQLEADLKATQRALTTAKRQLVDEKSRATLDSGSIIELHNQIEGLEKGAEAIENLIKELF